MERSAKPAKTLYLCGGLQSSGSTLVSWCFLQHPSLDGYLDADNDVFADLPKDHPSPALWYKTTISSFRMSDLIAHYRDDGWDVRPLLICRDVRRVWASLARKPYGVNGTTAEDPPLRLRMRRFKADWEMFQQSGWPILHYERFTKQPEQELRRVCGELQLPWDEALLTWPKSQDAILNARHGNATFRNSRGHGLLASLRPMSLPFKPQLLPPADLTWLEDEFEEYNRVNGYPLFVDRNIGGAVVDSRSIPSFQRTRRQKWIMYQAPMRYLLYKLGLRPAVAAMR